MGGDGIHYYNVKSLGKDSGSYYSIVAIDCNGVSSMTPSSGAWPVVLITAPVDKYIGGAVNPYAYTVPASSANFVRALVFDTAASPQVSYRIDGGTTWYPMTRVAAGSPVWQGAWNASGARRRRSHDRSAGRRHDRRCRMSITVRGHRQRRRTARLWLPMTATPGVSAQTLNVAAPGVLANDSDPDGDTLTAASWSAGPAHARSFTLNADGSFTYTPRPGYSGTDSFTYTAERRVRCSLARRPFRSP